MLHCQPLLLVSNVCHFWPVYHPLHRQILHESHLRDVIPIVEKILLERDILVMLLVDRERGDEQERDQSREQSHAGTEVEGPGVGDVGAGGEIRDQSWERPRPDVRPDLALVVSFLCGLVWVGLCG